MCPTLGPSEMCARALCSCSVLHPWSPLQTLPGDVLRLPMLEILQLEGNKLTTLPAEIGDMRRLRVLRADNNQLASVPGEDSCHDWWASCQDR